MDQRRAPADSIRHDGVYRTRDLVLALGINEAVLAKARLKGRLRYANIGKQIVYRGAWIEDWLECEANRVPLAPELRNKLKRPISNLALSFRVQNALERANIRTVRDLVQHTERDLLSLPGFGSYSLDEVKIMLGELGLYLGLRARDIRMI